MIGAETGESVVGRRVAAILDALAIDDRGAESARCTLMCQRKSSAERGSQSADADGSAHARSVRALLYRVSPFDPLTLGVAVAGLLVCAWLALLSPVRRATRVDLITVLR